MTYSRTHRPTDRVTTLVAVGALHAAAFYAVITGLSVAFVPVDNPPPITATNSPLPAAPPEPQPQTRATDPRVVPVPQPLPQPMPLASPLPQPSASLPADPGPAASGDPGGVAILPSPRPTLPLVTPRAARPLGQPGNWVTEADYPTQAIRLGHAGVVGFALAVSAGGRATGCEITRSSGFADLDALTCSLLLRRGRFAPASDEQGLPAPGRYASAVRWQIPD